MTSFRIFTPEIYAPSSNQLKMREPCSLTVPLRLNPFHATFCHWRSTFSHPIRRRLSIFPAFALNLLFMERPSNFRVLLLNRMHKINSPLEAWKDWVNFEHYLNCSGGLLIFNFLFLLMILRDKLGEKCYLAGYSVHGVLWLNS